jgi:serine protease Do
MRLAGIALCWTAALAALPPRGAASSLYVEASAPEGPRALAALPDLTRVAEAALPAVVGIVTMERDRDAPPEGDPLKDLYDRFHGDGARRGLATGFVIHPDGFIVTNAHVVAHTSRIEVDLAEDERVPAQVVGADQASDIALLKVKAERPLPVLPLGDSDRLRTAEWVMVMGNPFGLSRSVTAGIVSHIGRSDVVPSGRDGYYDFIQTDASINPGNSGGPVVNLRGEVVGIATAINATGQGIGFAVPINMAKDILGQLRDHGRVVRSWMGVSVREVHVAAAKGHARDIVVTDLVRGGPAAESGVQVGDVITGFEGRRIPSAARLRWYVATAGVGRSVSLTVRRGAAAQSVRVELAGLPETGASAARTSTDDDEPGDVAGDP